MTDVPAIDEELAERLRRLGVLHSGPFEATLLEGGVSSDIIWVEQSGVSYCVKRALPKLKVDADWQAPISRNTHEVNWMNTVHAFLRDAVPGIVAHDPEAGFFVMDYLPPEDYPVWKSQLRDGIADPATAQMVGERLATIHAHTAGDADIARRFATDRVFDALRLEPYLYAAAMKNPDLEDELMRLIVRTRSQRRALVHGDVSPKNILVGMTGPVFLDAECAWYGDPAFDLAFCLNHLLLKCLWVPIAVQLLIACFSAMKDTYLSLVDWEAPEQLESRATRLLPGLMLARVDGKSPVEYLDESEQDQVRAAARVLLTADNRKLDEVLEFWREVVLG